MTTDGIKKVSSYSAERLMESKQTLLLVALIKISLWKGSAAFSPASELDFTLPFLYVAELSRPTKYLLWYTRKNPTGNLHT